MAYSKMFKVAIIQRVSWYTLKNTNKLLLDLEISVPVYIKRKNFRKRKGVESSLQWNEEWEGGKESMSLGSQCQKDGEYKGMKRGHFG